jgi:single-strand DNA-binding protein
MLRISLIGRLGQDAVVNTVNGKTVINFSVAHSEKFKNQQGEDVENVSWCSCAYWTDKLNVANYLKKGSLIYMEGKPEAKTYLNDKTKETVAQLHSRVSSIQLLSSSKDETPF